MRRIVGLAALAAGLWGCTSLLGDFQVGDASTDATSDAQPDVVEGGSDVAQDVAKDSPNDTGPTCGNIGQQCCNSTCNQGACCGNVCVDVQNEQQNCGVCGHNCFGEQCVNAMCQPEKLTQISDYRPGRVRVDQNNAYFITVGNNNGALYSCSQQGCTTPTPLIKGFAYAYDMVLDDNFANVYVADFNAQKLYWCFTSGCNQVPGVVPTIPSGNVAGLSFRSELFAIIGVQPHEFHVDGTGDINLGNGNEGANYIAAPKNVQYVYWQNGGGHSVRSGKDNISNSATDFWSSTSGEVVSQVEGDGSYLAWVAEGTNQTNIYTCATNQTCNGNSVIASGNVGYEAGALVIDGPAKMVYWTGVDSNSSHVNVKACTATANCNQPITIASITTKTGGAVAGGVAVNQAYVFFTLEDAGTVYLYRVAK